MQFRNGYRATISQKRPSLLLIICSANQMPFSYNFFLTHSNICPKHQESYLNFCLFLKSVIFKIDWKLDFDHATLIYQLITNWWKQFCEVKVSSSTTKLLRLALDRRAQGAADEIIKMLILRLLSFNNVLLDQKNDVSMNILKKIPIWKETKQRKSQIPNNQFFLTS